MTWTVDSLVRQARTNLAAERWRSVFLCLLLLTICGLTLASNLITLLSVRTEQRSRAEHGLDVVIATSEGAIDAARCERLSAQNWVLASGSLTPGELDALRIGVGTKLPVGYVTAGFLDVVSERAGKPEVGDPPPIVLGPALRDYLGLAATGHIDLQRAGLIRFGSLGDSPKASIVSGWVLGLTASYGLADQCWVWVDSRADADPELQIRNALLGDTSSQSGATDEGLSITRQLGLNDRSRDLEAEWRDRPARAGLFGIAVLVVALTALLAYLRRTEVGLYRALGMAHHQLLIVGAIEVGVMLSGCLLVTVGLGWIFVTANDVLSVSDLAVALLDICLVAAIIQLVLPMSPLMIRTDISEALRDR